MSDSRQVIRQIQGHFHTLIREHKDASYLVAELDLPLLEGMDENHDSAFFQVPGMFGGFEYMLRRRNDEIVLFTIGGSRMDELHQSQMHKVTAMGYEVVATGEDVLFVWLKEAKNKEL